MNNFAIQNEILFSFLFFKWLVGSSTLEPFYYNVVLFDIDTRLFMEDNNFSNSINGRVSKSNIQCL